MSLRRQALRFTCEGSRLWELTPMEIMEIIEVRSALERERLEDLCRRNELLAFNIGALCRTAVNAPLEFPKTLSEAFGD